MSGREQTSDREPIRPAATTVRQVIARLPAADEVFRRFGMDTCCGGDLPVASAAEHHGVDLRVLLEALKAARAGG